MTKLAIAAAGCLATCGAANAQYLWIESNQGDLSDNRFLPSAFTLLPGDNILLGVLNGNDGNNNIDRDYISLTIPAGFELSLISLDNYLSTDFAAFMGVQPGPIFPNDPDTVQPEDLMGWTLFGPQLVGQDLLPPLSSNGQGFTPPLPAGTFTFWVQQFGEFTEWSGNFVVTEVPAPSSLAVLVVGGAGLARRRRS